MSDITENARETAKRLNMKIILPQPDELFVDLDTASGLTILTNRFATLQEQWPQATFTKTSSKSPNHYHVIVKIPELAPLDDLTRIALQSTLNSDWVREMLAIVRVTKKSEIITCFFEPKETAKE